MYAHRASQRVLFVTAADWDTRVAEAHHPAHLPDEIKRLGRYSLLVIDEISYLVFDPEAGPLLFKPVSVRYEGASDIATSNEPLCHCGRNLGQRQLRLRHDSTP